MLKHRPLRRKIAFTIMAIVLVLLLFAAIMLSVTFRNFSQLFDSTTRKMGNTASFMSSSFMGILTQRHMREQAADKADIVDTIFLDFEQSVQIVASAAEKIYADEDLYPPRPVQLPQPENDGKLTVQVLYASDTDPEDEVIEREVRLLGNMQETLLAVNQNSESIASNYFATESGIMIQADYISGKKFDDAGNLMPLNAKERPWYQGAASTGELYLTPVTRDLHTPRLGIMCGVPVYRDGRLIGVSGAGMYLDDVEALVQSVDLGENGNACIINQDGQVLFSTTTEGTFSVSNGIGDLRTSDNSSLANLVSRALQGDTGANRVTVDDVPSYVAFAPMKTVDWSFLIVMSQKEVDAPVSQMESTMALATNNSIEKVNSYISRTVLLLVAVMIASFLLSFLVSLILSRRIVKPIQKLTDSVSRIHGDNLDFQWDMDTGDETQLLANSFQSLTDRMKTYIQDIQDITAEKERIGAELNIATRIQADMMPSIFPAFPERPEFDIYAVMDPAKEVGGDFYDFFLIDDDHLGLVMADVSGKGIPAALFMMASKIMIANNVMNDISPAEVLEVTNNTICANNKEEMFVTVWLGILDLRTGKLTASNAGHEYPAIRRADGSFELLRDKHGFVVGGMAGIKYKNYEVQLSPGDELFLYTDGLPEATCLSNEQFGTDRMLTALNSAPSDEPKAILDTVKRHVDQFVGDMPQFDDLTMMCLLFQGNRRKTLTVEATLDNLEQVLSFIGSELDSVDCPMKTRMQIELAAEELFVNIANYAYAPEIGNAEIGVAIRESPREAVITFSDRGIPYDILAKKDPDVTLSAKERAIGGLGIYMVKTIMDDVRYTYRNEKNITTIRKKLDPS